MEEFIEYLQQNFDQSTLSPEESRIFSTYHLRFELGDPFKNGTKERVDQSTYRAKILFENFFKQEDQAWLLIKSWKYRSDNVKEFYSSTEGYLQQQIKSLSSLEILQREKTIEEFSEALNNNGVMEMTDFTTTHVQKVLCQGVSNINYENILRGIANLEMGFKPSIGEHIYFINRKSNIVFFMYDDRGCLLFSRNKNKLKPIYEKYSEWLVDYHRDTFVDTPHV